MDDGSTREAERLASLLAGLGLQVVERRAASLVCRAPGHPEVAGRLARHGVDVRPVGPEEWAVEVRDRPANDRVVQAVWALLAAF